MTADWMAAQLLARTPVALEVPRYNPRPAGVMREGSATKAVWDVLRARPLMFFTHAQIMASTRRSAKSVDWALIFLRSQAMVESVPDEGRNPRYLRYRVTKGKAHEHAA